MKTTFETVSLHYMVRLLGCTFSAAVEAVKTLGLKGRMADGARVWTREEVEQIRAFLNK